MAWLLWRGVVPLDSPQQTGEVVVTADTPALRTAPIKSTTALSLADLPSAPVPFVPGAAPAAVSQSTSTAASFERARQMRAMFGGTSGVDPTLMNRASLPFGGWAPQGPPPAPPAPSTEVARPNPEIAASPATNVAPADPPTPATTIESAITESLPLDAYPLHRCAAIEASLARRREDRPKTLEKNDLDEARWEALDEHWRGAIRDAGSRGKTDLLRVYDDAYVGQLEAERGPIEPEEYARVLVAAERGTERGTEREALTALGLPRGALLRVQRVWLRRMNESPRLGKVVRDAAFAARAQ